MEPLLVTIPLLAVLTVISVTYSVLESWKRFLPALMVTLSILLALISRQSSHLFPIMMVVPALISLTLLAQYQKNQIYVIFLGLLTGTVILLILVLTFSHVRQQLLAILLILQGLVLIISLILSRLITAGPLILLLSLSTLAVLILLDHGSLRGMFLLVAVLTVPVLAIPLRSRIREILLAYQHSKTMMEANRQLNRTNIRLTESNRRYRNLMHQRIIELHQLSRHASLAEITAGIAHEVSQPLTGIRNIAQNLMDDIDENQLDPLVFRHDLEQILSQINRISRIISHIQTFARKKHFSTRSLDVAELVSGALELVQQQLKDNEIELVITIPPQTLYVTGDRLSLEQLLVNLLLNARDAILKRRSFEPTHGGTIRLSLTADKDILIIIEDDGTGIQEDISEKIWSPFFTTKTGSGTGLGLSIARKIIEDHQGSYRVESNGGWTRFTIILPGEISTKGTESHETVPES
jgi:C4-dicarboxylate-specific signal transduction histidine kinase